MLRTTEITVVMKVIKMLHTILYVIVMTVSVACSVPRSAVWSPDERTGLGTGTGFLAIGKPPPRQIRFIERIIPVPLDTGSGTFDLYYFVRRPMKKAVKTVLFIPGGPGFFSPGPLWRTPMADFLLRTEEYNVVHFHPRGAGYSQVPSNNRYDRFLKSSNVVADIEAIRTDLTKLRLLDKEGQWDAIIGYSYGTVLAQFYAGTYPQKVKKLILIGVQSRHSFEDSEQAFSQISSEIRRKNRFILGRIFEAADFKDLSAENKARILDSAFGTEKVDGIYQEAEKLFGSLGFLIQSYCEPAVREALTASGLDKYSVNFFRALRGLRDVGWLQKQSTDDRGDPITYGKQIRAEIEMPQTTSEGCRNVSILDRAGSSDRVFYAVTIFDGINMRFLDALQKDENKGVLKALRRSGGEARVNKFIEKVGVDADDKIVPWNAQRYKYNGPTMILKGSADTVSAGGAAEHVFINALTGQRVLVIYPGIGHFYNLPLIPVESPASTFPSIICKPGNGIRGCLIYSFLEMSTEKFVKPSANKILPVITGDRASVCLREGSKSLTIAGKCP
jgi:pimeloyl-ACP methyl ester carboxylesterase